MATVLNTANTQANISSNIYTNGTNLVTAAMVASVLQNMSVSYINRITDSALLGLKVFSTLQSYSVGDCVVYSGILYQCTTAHSGAWNGADFTAIGGTGSVTTVSVVNANGFNGSVANASSTPAITISTTVTGLLKGNGTAISAAASGDVTTALGYTPVTNARTLTINGTTYDLTANRSWTINSMVYPSAGIAVSTGSAWGTSITDNSTNWNTAYSQTRQWDGGATGLVAATGRTSLGLVIGTNVQAYSASLTSLAALTYASASFVKMTAAGTFALDTNTYITGNQTITLSGNVTGSGTTAITTTIANLAVTNAMIAASTIDLTAKVTGLLPLANGGTNANLTASNGGIFYSTASAGAILAGTATANQILMSGANAAPSWSTATYPSTITSQYIPYATGTNTIGSSSGLQYDFTNIRLGIGGTPSYALHIQSPGSGSNLPLFAVINNSSSSGNRSSALNLQINGVDSGGMTAINYTVNSSHLNPGLNLSPLTTTTDITFRLGASATGGAASNVPLLFLSHNMRIAVMQGITPTAYFHIGAGTATANTAPLKFTSGTNLTTAEAGAFEYNGTNLFFSPSTTRMSVFVGNDGATAPTTTAGVVITNYYGSSATNFLGTPNSWASVVIAGTTYKLPLYT